MLRTDLRTLSEEQLRKDVILPVLAAMPNLHRITDVHGTNEKGLDVIFFESATIEDLCYGVQLKAEDIGGGGTGRKTVTEIVTQLGLASDLTHPVALEGAGVSPSTGLSSQPREGSRTLLKMR